MIQRITDKVIQEIGREANTRLNPLALALDNSPFIIHH